MGAFCAVRVLGILKIQLDSLHKCLARACGKSRLNLSRDTHAIRSKVCEHLSAECPIPEPLALILSLPFVAAPQPETLLRQTITVVFERGIYVTSKTSYLTTPKIISDTTIP